MFIFIYWFIYVHMYIIHYSFIFRHIYIYIYIYIRHEVEAVKARHPSATCIQTDRKLRTPKRKPSPPILAGLGWLRRPDLLKKY